MNSARKRFQLVASNVSQWAAISDSVIFETASDAAMVDLTLTVPKEGAEAYIKGARDFLSNLTNLTHFDKPPKTKNDSQLDYHTK